MTKENLPFTEPNLTICRQNLFAFFAITILVLIVYSNTYHASWHFDDQPNILDRNSLHLSDISWDNIKNTLFSGKKFYRPIPCFSFALNYYFGGENVLGYHIVNITIHILTSLFLFLFIRLTLKLPKVKNHYRNSYGIALLSTVLWASHPIQTQAVTYIVQRMASMAGLFYIMSFYFYVKGRTEQNYYYKYLFFFLCILSALFSFGSKENTIVLPIVIFAYDLILIQNRSFATWFRQNTKWVVLFILISSISGLIYLYTVQGGHFFSIMGRYESRPFTLTQRLLTEPRVIILYIAMLIYPIPSMFSINHDFYVSQSLFDPFTTLLSILLIFFLIIGGISIRKRYPLISFSVLFFFLNHLVESTFLPIELIFEHRNYIPSMLFFIPLSILFFKGLSFLSYKKVLQFSLIIFSVLFITGQGNATYIRNYIWKYEESLWIDCIEKYPDLWRPYHVLGKYYSDHNKIHQAIANYLVAITKKSRNNISEEVLTYNNLAICYQKNEEYEKALYYYQEAEKRNPFFVSTYVNRAACFISMGENDKSFGELSKAKRISYELPPSYYSNYGFLLLSSGKPKEAIGYLKQALKKGQKNSKTYRLLGRAYQLNAQLEKACLMYKRAYQLDRCNPVSLLHLYEVYSILGMESNKNNTGLQLSRLFRRNDGMLENFIDNILINNESYGTWMPDKTIVTSFVLKICEQNTIKYRNIIQAIKQKK